ncbi:MAG: DUF4399 domain-containing protein [SAR86 cluster bacterium]|jgi:hypothetical protein|nr:DUF4399 domain-containing protein [Gammaproteobacteria bacterium]MDG0966673.1 DUF4399 domain-containing protein [SAR86 cluster bacterium]MDG2347492.1 DUF4399 domain-containing protein [SAR86 cluster bacterium]|tara:strand:- start:1853 stop:2257 length:405 start_codon:yes stop_codon:yes gene_type:complete
MKYFLIFLFSISVNALEITPGSSSASVYFITPLDGESVSDNVTVRFGLENFGVAPAGIQINQTGHHHLIIDADLPPLDQPIPANNNYVHFGKGQTEVEIDLSKGTHTLQLLLGDFRHIPHNPPIYSKKIQITAD